MRFKKVILAIISVAYTLVLVHNLTPHRHNNAQKKLNSESSTLNNWFNFIFGSEHENSVQDDDHLARFLLSENDNCDESYLFSECGDDEKIIFQNTEIYFAEASFVFSLKQKTCFLNPEKVYSGSPYTNQHSGRAPPVLPVI